MVLQLPHYTPKHTRTTTVYVMLVMINNIQGEKLMPNHCHNRVTFYAHHSDDEQKSQEQIAKLKEYSQAKVFSDRSYQNQTGNTPLLTSDNQYGTKYGNDGVTTRS